jgi:long-chain acyl-CoA synthetase
VSGTLAHATLARLRVARDATAMVQPTDTGEWVPVTWGCSATRVLALARWLRAHGVTRGERVAILGPPHVRWVEADLATLLTGGVVVGIYPTLLPAQVAWQVRHSGARVLLGPSLDALEGEGLARDGVTLAAWDVAHPGEAEPCADSDLDTLAAFAEEVQPGDPCAIFYTSGTTGEPKGAVVTHAAMLATVLASRSVLSLEPDDGGASRAGERPSSLVFLPLAHSLQRMVLYRGLLEDVEAWVVPTLEQVPDAIVRARPTLLATVPRMLEKVLARAEATAAQRGSRAAATFRWAIGVAREVSLLREQGRSLPVGLRLRAALAERLVWGKVRARMGGRLHTLVCGGARLNPEVGRAFHGMGIDVCEGWGLTETCAPATLNTRADVRFGTVGRPLPGMELRLDADGEVLVRGAGCFSGYWRAPEATAAAFTHDGWFRTGDIGRLDAEGRLSIMDRKKELIVTSGGKNLAPLPIEGALEGAPFAQVVVIGDERPYLVALFAPEHPVEGEERSRLLAVARGRVEAYNARVPGFEQVKRTAVLDGPLAVDDGTLTPTLKVKRRAVAERHREAIEALYAGA